MPLMDATKAFSTKNSTFVQSKPGLNADDAKDCTARPATPEEGRCEGVPVQGFSQPGKTDSLWKVPYTSSMTMAWSGPPC
jgi:hypothetical protein